MVPALCCCGTDAGIAQIGQVTGPWAVLQMGVLEFDEVAHMGLAAQFAARAQTGEGTDVGASRPRRRPDDCLALMMAPRLSTLSLITQFGPMLTQSSSTTRPSRMT